MQIIINSSPLIFLSKLNYLNLFVESPDDFYIPQSVADEIKAKSDPSSQTVQVFVVIPIRNGLTPHFSQTLGAGSQIFTNISLNPPLRTLD